MTHRCKELLDYNKNYGHKHSIPVSIRYEKWFSWYNLDSDYPSWILSNLTHDAEWGTRSMSKSCRIKYCPFCGEKLKDYNNINIDK